MEHIQILDGLLFAQIKILDVSGGLVMQNGSPDLNFAGTGKTVTKYSGNAGEGQYDTGLSVISVHGNEGATFSKISYLQAQGYGLVSTSKVLIQSSTLGVGPNEGIEYPGVPKHENSQLVFQNQDVGSNDAAYYSINADTLRNARTDKGIYIDTSNLNFVAESSTLKTYKDFQINLGDETFTLENSIIDATNGSFYLTKSGDASMEVSGGSNIQTSKFFINDGAAINVAADSSAFFGTLEKTENTDNALTIGGEGFSLGTSDAPTEGRISVQGSTLVNGGSYIFDGQNIATEVGLLSKGAISVQGGASLTLSNGSHLFAGNGYGHNVSGHDLIISGDGTIVTVAGRGQSSYPDASFYQASFDAYGGNGKKDQWANWAIAGGTYDVDVSDEAVVNVGSAGVLFAQHHQLKIFKGATLNLDGSGSDPATIISGGSTSANSTTSTFKNNVWIESGGAINYLGGHFDVKLSNPRGIVGHSGAVKLISVKGDTDTLDGLMKIQKGLVRGNGSVTLYGDSSVTISSTKVLADQTSSNTIAIVSAGDIAINNGATLSVVSNDYANGSIKIYGGNATVPETASQGNFAINTTITAANTDKSISIGAAEDKIKTSLKANTIELGTNDFKAKSINLVNASLTTTGDAADDNQKSYAFNLYSGADGLTLENSDMSYQDADGGQTNLLSNGNIVIKKSNINDGSEGSEDLGDGVLTIAAVSGKSIQIADGSKLNDDVINLGTGVESVSLSGASSVWTDGNGQLSVSGASVSLSGGSHFGNEDGASSGVGGPVQISTPDLSLEGTSFINSSGDVAVKALGDGDTLKINMDESGVASTGNSWIKGQNVSIGSNIDNTKENPIVEISGGVISANDAGNVELVLGETDAEGENLINGTQIGSASNSVKISTGDGVNANANLSLGNTGSAAEDKVGTSITGSNDNISLGTGELVVTGKQDQNDANANSHITGGSIDIDAGRVDLSDAGWIKGNATVDIAADEVSLDQGSHIGSHDSATGTDDGGSVILTTNKVTVAEDGYITSSGTVDITTASPDGNLSITMNGSGDNAGWIKGDSVNIGGLATNPGHLPEGGAGNVPSISIVGGSITASGTPAEGSELGQVNIAVGGAASNKIDGSQIAADGSVNIKGPENSAVKPTLDITNGSIIAAGEESSGSNAPGDLTISDVVVNVGTASDKGGNHLSGNNISISAGAEVNIGTGDGQELNTIIAGNGTDGDGVGAIDLDGTLNMGNGAYVEAEGDIAVDGSVHFTGKDNNGQSTKPADGTSGKPTIGRPTLVAGGAVSVGSADGSASNGSVVAEEGGFGTIIAGDTQQEVTDGNLHIGNGGTLTVENGGGMLVTNDQNAGDNQSQSQTGLVIDSGTKVVVDSGTLEVDKVVSDSGDQLVAKGDAYLKIDDPFGADGKPVFTVGSTDDANNPTYVTVEVGENNSLTQEQIKDLLDTINEGGSQGEISVGGGQLVVNVADDDDLKTQEQWEELYGEGIVTSNKGVDVSQAGASRPANSIGHGGGSYLVGSPVDDSGDVTINIIGKDQGEVGKVTITGTQDRNQKPEEFDVVQSTGSSGGSANISLGNNTSLTMGNGGSYSGHLPGSIEAANDGSANVDIVNGNWTLDGGIDLGNGDLTLNDRFNDGGLGKSELEMTGDLSVGNLTMMGDSTSLRVDGETNITGNANLTGGYNDDQSGAHVVTNDAFNVDGILNMDGNSSLKDAGSENSAGNGQQQVNASEINLSDNAVVDRGNIVVAPGEGSSGNGNLNLSGNASLSANDIASGDNTPALNVAGDINLGVTDDENHNEIVGSNPTLNANGDIVIGGALNQANGTLTATGDITADSEYLNQTGGTIVSNGNVTFGPEGAQPGSGTNLVGGILEVGGKGTFNGGLHIADGGFYDTDEGKVTGSTADEDLETQVKGDLTIGSADGTQGAQANLGDVKVDGATTVNNANVTTGGFAGQKLEVGENAQWNSKGDIALSGDDANLIVTGGSVNAEASGASKGDINVGGYADISSGSVTASGTLKIDGTSSADEGGNRLVVGTAGAEPGADGSYDKTASVDVGGLVVKGPTQVNGDGTLTSHGDSNFNGGLHVNAGGDYVNTNPESTTTVKDHLWLDAGSSIDVKGEFTLAADTVVGNTSDTGNLSTEGGVLHGTISAGNLNLGAYNGTNPITFEGGVDSEGNRFEAGFSANELTGDVALSNGANGVLAPAADGSPATVNGWINVNAGDEDAGVMGSTLTTNPANKGQYSTADATSSESFEAVLDMDSPINFAAPSQDATFGLTLGDLGTTSTDKSGIYFGTNASMKLDAENFASGSPIFDNGTAAGMPIYTAAGITADNPITIDMSNWLMGEAGSLVFDVDAENAGAFNFASANVLQSFSIQEVNGVGSITMQVRDVNEATGGTLDEELQEVVTNVTKLGAPSYVNQAFNALFSKTGEGEALNLDNAEDSATYDALIASGLLPEGAENVVVSAYGVSFTDRSGKSAFVMTNTGNKAVKEIATYPVMSGAFNATFDYLKEFNRAVETRALEKRDEGSSNSVWAHVIATYDKSNELFDGSGYKAELYGGVLGTDAKLSNGTLIGGALTVGTGDIESRGAVIDTKNDATFYGLSLYAEHEIGELSLKGDVTYLKTENDIAGTFEGVNMGGSMDTDAISVGVRAEFTAYAGDVFSVKPHIGLRYTNYSFENYRGTEVDDVNVLETPVGVAFTGKVAAVGGWTVVPELDLSVVPQLGDREATVVNAGAGVDQRVLEGAVFNAKLGLGMQKDNFTFGANFQHGEGGFGRNNNAFQAYARWLF